MMNQQLQPAQPKQPVETPAQRVEKNLTISFQKLMGLQSKIKQALPTFTTLRAERLVQLFNLEMRRNPQLGLCSPESFCASIIACAQLGLEPGVAGRIYLIKRWNDKAGVEECTTMLGYKGMLELSFRTERMNAFEAVVVYEKDRFLIKRGTHPEIIHEETMGERGPIVGAYAIATHKNGQKQFEFMRTEEIEAIRKRCSTSKKDKYAEGGTVGPWVTDKEAMYQKTVLRKILKICPSSTDMDTALFVDEAIERGDIDRHKEGIKILSDSDFKGNVVDLPKEEVSQQDALVEKLGA